MRERIALNVLRLIEEEFARGASVRIVSEKFQINRNTAYRIRNQEYTLQKPATEGPQYARCPGCGGMVQMPCILCRHRSGE